MEITPENLAHGLNRYSTEITAIYMYDAGKSFHITRASAMKQLLYSLGVLDDISNSAIVDEAKRTAELRKAKLQKKREGK